MSFALVNVPVGHKPLFRPLASYTKLAIRVLFQVLSDVFMRRLLFFRLLQRL